MNFDLLKSSQSIQNYKFDIIVTLFYNEINITSGSSL